uniref:Ribonuclease H-like domain-containing protein n=1 Tax=Tanacetum cinerariifolium TaxID=118510 RepID=A0A6L2P0M1_TANCI|nr:ribonuclease H-like domain-containing protein [Tanacetum cinerariifolium]
MARSDTDLKMAKLLAFAAICKNMGVILADSLLPIPFWAEAVNTTCYVQNRVFVTKPHNKTPYELLLGRTPSLGFMRPFGCHVVILNTLDPLRKFDRKADKGFLVGYSISSKAFRVINSRTRIVQEKLHINFLENQPIVAGSGPTWLFDIDTLTQSKNYQPVIAWNQPNSSAGILKNLTACTLRKEAKFVQQYVLLPLWSSGFKDTHNTDAAAFEVKELQSVVHVSPSSCDQTKKHDNKTKREAKGKSRVELSIGVRDLHDEFEEFSDNSTNGVNAASTPVTVVGPTLTNSTNPFSVVGPSNNAVSLNFELGGKSSFMDPSQYPDDPDMPALQDITYSDDEEDVSAEADFSNLETNITYNHIPTTRVHKDHPVTQIISDLSLAPQTMSMTRMVKSKEGIDYEEFFSLVARIEAIHLFLAYASFMGFMGKIDQTLFIKKQKGDILLVQVYVDDIIFGSTNKDLCKAFEKLIKDKFQMSTMGELTFFLGLQVKQKQDGMFISQDKYVAKILRKFGLTNRKSASTPIDTEKPLLKDPDDMRRVGKGFLGEDTPLFAADIAPPLPPPQQQPSQTAAMSMTLLNTLLETCATLTKQVANLEQDKIAQAIKITKLKQRVKRLEKKRQFKSSGLKRMKKVGTAQRVESSADTVMDDQEDASKQGRKIVELDADEDVTLEEVDIEVTKDADV